MGRLRAERLARTGGEMAVTVRSRRLLAEGTCSDVIVCAGDAELRAHRAVLLARTPRLSAALSGGQSPRPVLRLDGVGLAETRRFLR